jgi:hypothetical protein
VKITLAILAFLTVVGTILLLAQRR